MEPRVSLITLGVAEVARAQAFYEAIGFAGESPDGDVVFIQAGGMVLALWSRAKLAEDSTVVDAGGWGGITLAHNVGHRGGRRRHRRGGGGRRHDRPTRCADGLGWLSAVFIDPDGHPWEVAHNPHWVLHDDGTTSRPRQRRG